MYLYIMGRRQKLSCFVAVEFETCLLIRIHCLCNSFLSFFFQALRRPWSGPAWAQRHARRPPVLLTRPRAGLLLHHVQEGADHTAALCEERLSLQVRLNAQCRCHQSFIFRVYSSRNMLPACLVWDVHPMLSSRLKVTWKIYFACII